MCPNEKSVIFIFYLEVQLRARSKGMLRKLFENIIRMCIQIDGPYVQSVMSKFKALSCPSPYMYKCKLSFNYHDYYYYLNTLMI